MICPLLEENTTFREGEGITVREMERQARESAILKYRLIQVASNCTVDGCYCDFRNKPEVKTFT